MRPRRRRADRGVAMMEACFSMAILSMSLATIYVTSYLLFTLNIRTDAQVALADEVLRQRALAANVSYSSLTNSLPITGTTGTSETMAMAGVPPLNGFVLAANSTTVLTPTVTWTRTRNLIPNTLSSYYDQILITATIAKGPNFPIGGGVYSNVITNSTTVYRVFDAGQ